MANIIMKKVAIGLLAGGFLLGCDEPQPVEYKEQIKAMKYLVVEAQQQHLDRRLSGFIQASQTAQLSFQVSGQLMELHAEAGSSVPKGQVLATLDQQPYQLRVAQSEAKLASAQAQLNKEKESYHRQKQVFEKRLINQETLDLSFAQYEQAKNNVQLAKANLSLAQRDLTKSQLLAPFSGVITNRFIETFEDVSLNQPVLEIQGEEQFEVNFLLPSNLVKDVSIGEEITVSVAEAGIAKAKAKINKLELKADTRGSFPVSAQFIQPQPSLKSGLIAEAFVDVSETASPLVIPESAVIFNTNNQPQVFVYDKETSQVSGRQVRTKLFDLNHVQVLAGLEGGETICKAGCEFLREQQRVKLFQASGQPSEAKE